MISRAKTKKYISQIELLYNPKAFLISFFVVVKSYGTIGEIWKCVRCGSKGDAGSLIAFIKKGDNKNKKIKDFIEMLKTVDGRLRHKIYFDGVWVNKKKKRKKLLKF